MQRKKGKRKMATNILSTSNPFLAPSSSSSSLSFVTPTYVYCNNPITKCTVKRDLTLCKAGKLAAPHSSTVTKRDLSVSFITSFLLSLGSKNANAAILEADEDDELMEKVKRDRKKRLEKQGVISSSKQETGPVLHPILLFAFYFIVG